MTHYSIPFYPSLHSTEPPPEAGFYLVQDDEDVVGIVWYDPDPAPANEDREPIVETLGERLATNPACITDWYGPLKFSEVFKRLEKEKDGRAVDFAAE